MSAAAYLPFPLTFRSSGVGAGLLLGLSLLTAGCVVADEGYYYNPGYGYYEPGYSGTVIYRQAPTYRSYWSFDRGRDHGWHRDGHSDGHRDGHGDGHRDGHGDRRGWGR